MKTKNAVGVNTHGIFLFDNQYWEKNVDTVNKHLSDHISQVVSKTIREVLEYCIDVFFKFETSGLVLVSKTLETGWWKDSHPKRNFLINKKLKKHLLKKNRFINTVDINKAKTKTLRDVFFYLRSHLYLINIDLTKDCLNTQLTSKQLSLDQVLLTIPESFIIKAFTKNTIDSVDYNSGVMDLMKTYIKDNPKKFLKIMNDDVDQLKN
jgi:hypothetical protein